MKTDYGNWMPKKKIFSYLAGFAASLFFTLFASFSDSLAAGPLKTAFIILFLLISFIFLGIALWSIQIYKAFDPNGQRQMAKQLIDGITSYLNLPEGSTCLDVGCKSGVLAIAAAKRNPHAKVIGVVFPEKDKSSSDCSLCEQNASAEGAENIHFQQEDPAHLSFADETFDALIGNFAYYSIMAADRQSLLLEALRTLKKGGTFVIHDVFSVSRYGDMNAFLKKLEKMEYQKAELIDTTDGMFMDKKEAAWMMLTGSALLKGIK